MTSRKQPGPGGDGARARHSSGTPQGGRFASRPNSEASVTLPAAAPGLNQDPVGSQPAGGELIDSAAGTEDGEQLWRFVNHPDPLMRSVAARNPNVTAEMVRILMGHQQPVSVRVNVASRNPALAAALAAKDPSPFVRVWALAPAVNLPAQSRFELGRDDQVWRLQQLAGDPFALRGGPGRGPQTVSTGPRA